MRISYRKYDLKLKTPFRLSYGTYDQRSSFIVELRVDELLGLGEAVCIDYYGWSEQKTERDIHILSKRITDKNIINCSELRFFVQQQIDILTPVRSAFDCALWDIEARAEGKKLQDILQTHISPKNGFPQSSYTISGQHAHEIDEQIRTCQWPILKVKMGSGIDKEIAEIMANYPDRRFRVDANAGWILDSASTYMDILHSIDLEFVEQPFPDIHSDWTQWLRKSYDVEVMADESCQDIGDIPDCTLYFNAINVKLMKCGGITPALDMIRTARSYGMKIMIGCMTESSCGISAAAQLLSMVDYVDLDGSNLILNDPAVGTRIENGQIHLNDQAGIGVQLIDY